MYTSIIVFWYLLKPCNIFYLLTQVVDPYKHMWLSVPHMLLIQWMIKVSFDILFI